MKNTVKKDQEIGQILGIKVISTQLVTLLTGIKENLSHNKRFYIVTTNPELVLMAQEDKDLAEALNDAQFSVPDGVGLNYASKFLFGRGLTVIPGRVLFMELIRLADKNRWKVFFLGGKGNEARLAAAKLQKIYKNIRIGTFRGPDLNKKGAAESEVDKKIGKDAVDKINEFGPKFLFVAFGNPKQEIWIHNNLSKLKIGAAMAVGGTFRYTAGLSVLPPVWMEKAGLEWLWRLINEPKRIGRIFNAVIVFPLKVFIYKITG